MQNTSLSRQSFSEFHTYMTCLLQYLVTCMCLLRYLVTCKGHCIILLAILRVACPMLANVSYILHALTKVCVFLKRSAPSKGHFTFYILHIIRIITLLNILQLILQNVSPLFVNMCLYSSLCQVGKVEKCGSARDFPDLLLDVPLVYMLPYFVVTAPRFN